MRKRRITRFIACFCEGERTFSACQLVAIPAKPLRRKTSNGLVARSKTRESSRLGRFGRPGTPWAVGRLWRSGRCLGPRRWRSHPSVCGWCWSAVQELHPNLSLDPMPSPWARASRPYGSTQQRPKPQPLFRAWATAVPNKPCWLPQGPRRLLSAGSNRDARKSAAMKMSTCPDYDGPYENRIDTQVAPATWLHAD